MQLYFLNNMVTISVAALVFSAISFGAIKENEPTISPEKAESEGTVQYNSMVERETSPLKSETELEAEEALQRTESRLNVLNDSEEGMTGEDHEESTEAPLIEPNADIPHASEQEEVSATPSSTQKFAKSMIGNIKLVAWDDEESRPEQPPIDPNDPTEPGDRKGGAHKGKPKFINPKMIPIIKMGEDVPEQNGLTVIKAWNN